MKIVFNSTYKNAASMICIDDLSKKFLANGDQVFFNDWRGYEKYDIAIFMSPDSDVENAKKINPKIICGIMDPKLNTRRKLKESTMADFLGVSSIEQRDAFLKYNPNIFIYYMFPETPEIHKQHSDKEKIVIGYHGNKLHLHCMKNLNLALDALSEKYPIELWSIYNIHGLGRWRFNLPRKCPVKHIQWTRDVYEKELSQCDIGVIPAIVPINEGITKITSRFISSFFYNWPGYYKHDYIIRFKYSTNPGRAYVFSQLGIPIVAEFLPSYSQIIQDNHSGFLVYSREGWYNALETLIKDAQIRQKMAENLKNHINSTISPDITFKKFLDFLNSIIIKY